RFTSWQQSADLSQGRARGVQHDVFTFLDLLHTVYAHHQTLDPLVLPGWQLERRPDHDRVTFQHRLDLTQVIGLQCGPCRYEVADQIGARETRCNLDRPGEGHDLGADIALAQISLQQVRIGCRNPLTAQRARALEYHALRNRQRQAAAPEVQHANVLESRS